MEYGKGYHKYFDGYTEIKVPKKNGKGEKIQRIYTSEFYQQDLSDKEWKKHRILSISLYVFGILALIIASAQPVEGNTKSIMVFPISLALVSFLWLSYNIIPYLLAGRKLMRRQYREKDNVVAASAAAAACMTLCTIAAVASQFIYQQKNLFSSLLSVFLFAFGAGAMFWIHSTEKGMDYIRVENTVDVKEGYDIRYEKK